VLHIGDRFGHRGLRYREIGRSLRHTAALDHSNQNMQVSQLETPSDTIGPLHGGYLSKWLCYDPISELDMYVSTAHNPIKRACGSLDVCWLDTGPTEGLERGPNLHQRLEGA
jgi:hypothetical protein